MHRRVLPTLVAAILLGAISPSPPARAQSAGSATTFRAGVELVSVAAVVRDGKGRVVRSLTPGDFTATDNGEPRAIVDVQSDHQAPASVAFLVDGSGSMRLGRSVAAARDICDAILYRLRHADDAAALFSFDTRLLTLREFTTEFDGIREGLDDLDSFGATSLYDAIAGSAGVVAERARERRAVVVFTDGSDNASAYSPDQVAWIASTIDVPVYVFAVGRPDPETAQRDQEGARERDVLQELARATGGDYFDVGDPRRVHAAVTTLLEELRHQYLIAFEPARATGLRRIEIRTRDADLRVTARKWYASGGMVARAGHPD